MPLDAASALVARLAVHVASNADEARGLATMRAFLSVTPAPFTRRTLEGHVTGSAVVLGPDGRALLLFHARLALWVQPGGHVEDGELVEAAALREAVEETGLTDLALVLDPGGAALLLDVDVHPIPANAKRGEPAHHHHDVCFLALTRQPADARVDPDESRELRWIDRRGLDDLPLDPATRRRLEKAFALPR